MSRLEAAAHLSIREAKTDVVMTIPTKKDDALGEKYAIDKGTLVSLFKENA